MERGAGARVPIPAWRVSCSRRRPRVERARDLAGPAHLPDTPIDQVMMERDAPAEAKEDISAEVRRDDREPHHPRPIPDETEQDTEGEIADQRTRRHTAVSTLVLPDDSVVLNVVEDRQRR